MQSNQLKSLLEPAIALAESVGAYQFEHFRTKPPGGGSEKAAREYVSEIDVESEHRLKEGLIRLIPEAGFYGEETEQSRGEFTWVVDPLDGTSNYLSGIDVWAVSIALLKGEKIILGVVHKPSTGETFNAVRGEGAFHDGKKLESAKRFRLKDSLVGTGLPYRSPDTTKSFFESAEEILFKSRDIRRIGSAALDLAYVAAGYLQAFWEIDLQSYDLAAALLFLEEAGCPYSTIRGNPYDPFRSRSFVTGRPGAMEELREVLSRHYSVD